MFGQKTYSMPRAPYLIFPTSRRFARATERTPSGSPSVDDSRYQYSHSLSQGTSVGGLAAAEYVSPATRNPQHRRLRDGLRNAQDRLIAPARNCFPTPGGSPADSV